jgi:hypothetical protein
MVNGKRIVLNQFPASFVYEIGMVKTSLQFRLAKWNIHRASIFRFQERQVKESGAPVLFEN